MYTRDGHDEGLRSVSWLEAYARATRQFYRAKSKNVYGELQVARARARSLVYEHCLLRLQIATISPGLVSAENTLNTLRYADR